MVAVMVIMLIDDSGEDVVRSDDIGGSDGDDSEDDNGGDAVGSDNENANPSKFDFCLSIQTQDKFRSISSEILTNPMISQI